MDQDSPQPSEYHLTLFSDIEPGILQNTAGRFLSNPPCFEAFYALIPYLKPALDGIPDPARVMYSLEQLITQSADPLKILRFLANNPRTIDILVRVFSSSQYLTEIVLRNPQSITNLPSIHNLARAKSVDQMISEIKEVVSHTIDTESSLTAIRRYQGEELLRIGTCDILDAYDLPTVTQHLSNLAEALIRTCLQLAADEINTSPRELIVIGMGKLGGRELNYSSDIDLLFLSKPNSKAAQALGVRLIDFLARITSEGFLYRVDMRLRPWGRVGPLVSTIDGYKDYLSKNARLWEKQSLLKARPVAGNTAAGRRLLDEIRPQLFNHAFNELQESVFDMKLQTENHLRQAGHIWGQVKLGEGSIRDIEFTVQFLQLAYGARLPEIISPNSLDALVRISAAGLIRQDEFRILSEGYVFLRTVEHFLQMLDYRQTNRLPEEPEAIAALARRLGFTGDAPGTDFLERYQQRGAEIRAVFLKYVGGSKVSPSSDTPQKESDPVEDPSKSQQIHQHIRRMSSSYSESFSENEITQHAAMAAHLSDENPAEIEAVLLPGKNWKVTVVAYDFGGEFSVLTGLMFIYGLSILSGEAFTYKPAGEDETSRETRRKIVDMFVASPVKNIEITPAIWANYSADLAKYQRLAREGLHQEMLGDVIQRVSAALRQREPVSNNTPVPVLYPISIEIDNDASEQMTILRIEAQDTLGFLYELSNSLTLNGIYIDRVVINTIANRVNDVVYVTDASKNKITDPKKQQELRVATVLIKHFTHLLPFSPNPETALLHFRDFIDRLFHNPNWVSELSSVEKPEVLHALARVLGVSDFLWDDFLRMQYANLFPVVTNTDALQTAKSRDVLQKELEDALRVVHAGPQILVENPRWIETITDWRDREMFRIDMRHILGHTHEFWDFAQELSDLAEVFTNACFHLCHEDLREEYGSPQLEDGSPSGMAVFALGKFGGRELGFASDIELMFIYDDNGKTNGTKVTTNAEFYERLVEVYNSLMRARREGIFHVDLQLRPYGKAGSMAVSLESFRRYFAPGGPAWPYERQALVKLRYVAGDKALGEKIAALRDEFVYTGEPFDATAMRAMRERQIRHLTQGNSFNLKYSSGGLTDAEYLVQGLQISHGKEYAELRRENTREAMAALAQCGFLSEDDYSRLRKAHTFLRWFIDSLRVVRGNAKDIMLPQENTEEFAFLTRRMLYGEDQERLKQDLISHSAAIREISRRLLD